MSANIRLTALSTLLVCLASPVLAQVSEEEALRILVSRKLETWVAAKVERASARDLRKPYNHDDSAAEKQARVSWYSAQLPDNFPGKGKVSVVYLTTCAPDQLFDDESVGNDAAAVFDQQWVALARSRARLPPINLRSLRRPPYSLWTGRPDPSIKFFNDAAARSAAPVYVIEPYCGPSGRPRVHHYPEGPPPQPPQGPFYIKLIPGNTLFIISEGKSDLCELQGMSQFDQRCRGWRQVSSNPILATGSRYRYRALRPGAATITGEFHVGWENGSRDHPLDIIQP